MNEVSLGRSAPALLAHGIEVPRQLERLVAWVRAYDSHEALWALALVLLGFLAGRLLAKLCLRILRHAVSRTASKLDDALVAHLAAPLFWGLPVLVVRWLLPLVELPKETRATLSHSLLVALILCAGWLCARGLRIAEDYVISRYDISVADNLEARRVFTQVRALKNIAHFVVAVLTAGAALITFEGVRSLGAGLLASTGVLGVILGFAAQKSIATVISGIHIAVAQPVRVDDVVIVEGEWGRIEEITLTYVVVRIWDLRRLIVPVNYFLEKPFQNWTRGSSELLGTSPLHLDYSVPLDELRAEFKRILEASPHWDGKTSGLQVTDATDKTIVVRPLMSAKDAGAAWELRCEVREKLITFLQRRYPAALPRQRAELSSLGSAGDAPSELPAAIP